MKHIKSYDQFLLEDAATAIEDRVNTIGEPQDKADTIKKDLEENPKDGKAGKDEPKSAKSVDGGADDKSAESDKIAKHSSSDAPTEAGRQGYDDREDESIGARDGAEKDKKQSDKARREDSYGKWGKRGEEDRDGEDIDRAKNEAEGFKPSGDGKEISLDETYEKHDTYDARLVAMPLGKVLDKLKQKDPTGYADIEKYLEKNFKDLTSADESWFTTMVS